MRELRVEDALLYLDQVKMEFGDRPHIYNEFLDIMKTFKTQQLDTPGVIRRVSSLFQGNRKLVLGFNTFLPEGYKIELDGDGPPVAVYRAPGQASVTHILGPAASANSASMPPGASASGPAPTAQAMGDQAAFGARPMPQQQQQMRQGQQPGGVQQVRPQQQPMQRPPGQQGQQQGMDQGAASDSYQQQMRQQQQQQQQAMQMQQAAQRQQTQQQMMGPDTGTMNRMGGEARGNGAQQQRPHAQNVMSGPGQQPQPGTAPMQQQQMGVQGPSLHQQQQEVAQPPVEFDHAINYVTTIKKRFAAEPETYKKFLEILHTYQKEQRGIKEVLDEVSVLFADHPDLLKEFTYFLPDAVQAQAKAQLDAVAKESEARKRAASSKQAIMQTAQGMQRQAQGLSARNQGAAGRSGAGNQVFAPTTSTIPFGASQGRTDEREREICRSSIYGSVHFAPVRPPRRNEPNVAQAAMKDGRPHMIPELPVQPTTSEAAFFERAKLHLNRRELLPDKLPGSRRHTPYTEFLKCLHLFGAEVLNKEELLILLRGLFMQGHAPKSGINAGGGASNPAVANDAQELLKEFEEVLIGRGPYADQENLRKDKSKYGSRSRQDFDYSNCDHPTPSYRKYPSDYPHSLFFTHSGQTEADASVLNNSVIAVVPQRNPKKRYMLSPEEYDGVKVRKNVHEEAMFKAEDERYEVDMAIERNVMAMRQVEPMAEEVTRLREIEEKDGQPIGRMTYKLRTRTLNCSQINAIARMYGEKGDEVVQHLMRNPIAVLPIVYRRLRQKDGEWRRARTEMAKEWNAIYEANYEGSLDVLCSTLTKELERIVSPDRLLSDCKKTRHFLKHPRTSENAAIKWAVRELFATCSVPEEVLFQPHVRVPMNESRFPHKDVFHLVSSQALNGIKSSADRERVARVWAEFVAPWFGYSSFWLLHELRDSYRGDNSTGMVTYSAGQRVRTCYGDGVIQGKILASHHTGMRYKVKLLYGMAYLRPSCIVHTLPATDPAIRMVRRNGSMEKASLLEGSEEGVDPRCKIMFGTERVYAFVRIYCFLALVLADTQSFLALKTGDDMDVSPAANGIGSAMETTEEEDEEEDKISHDYPGLLATLQKLISGSMDNQAFESFCRKTTKEKVYQLIALPKLIERCAEALVKVAKEDKVLSLFDLSQLKIMDPERLRVLSHSESTDACYRLQFDPVQEFHYFCYLGSGEQVLLSPPPAEEEDVGVTESEAVAETTEAMDTEGDEVAEETEADETEPDAKRQKVK